MNDYFTDRELFSEVTRASENHDVCKVMNVSVIEAHKRQSHKYGNILMPLTIRGTRVTSIHLENNHVPERANLKKWL